jgi:hypothetical protein
MLHSAPKHRGHPRGVGYEPPPYEDAVLIAPTARVAPVSKRGVWLQDICSPEPDPPIGPHWRVFIFDYRKRPAVMERGLYLKEAAN